MPDRADELYSVQRTMIWFAAASMLLAASLVLLVWQDHAREWKKYQREFLKLERERVESELQEAARKVDQKKLEELEKLRVESEKEFTARASEMKRLESKRAALSVESVKANTRYQDLKQHYDSYKYFFEEHRLRGDKAEEEDYLRKMTTAGEQMERARLEKESVEEALDEVSAEIASFQSKAKEAQKKIDSLLKEKRQLERKIEKLKPSAAQSLLDAPMLDFIAPSLQIQQIVLEDLHEDFYFAKAQAVDRCPTCHLAIDRPGFETAPEPFRTHPKLDLFLASGSPHPLEKAGCTVCHGGSGNSLSFVKAAHEPQSDTQAREWKKKYGWKRLEKWESKMLPRAHMEAACAQCHKDVMEVPEAPKLNEGRRLAQTFGCYGCHLVKGLENRWKVGPSLYHMASKVDRAWIIRWLQNPKAFRSSTQMPRIFHLENTDSPEDRAKSNAAIEGIAAYLLKHSAPLELQSPPLKGDPVRGKKLLEETGCFGCHSAGGVHVNDLGPELTHLGSKVSQEWLYMWLKDPSHVSPETRMPNLRLTDEEAADIASFLRQSRNLEFESSELPRVEEKDLDELAVDYMTRKMRTSEAQEKLSTMNREAKLEFVGREMILQQGCFGCHDIHGFEDQKRIGTELTDEGAKEVERLDFGFVPIERVRQAWFYQKLLNPRIFDRGKVKGYHEKLRMPVFDFSAEQAEALTTFLLSLREKEIPLEMTRSLDLKEKEIEEGRVLVSKFNCQGCHTLDGKEGRVRALFEEEEAGYAPPVLDGEGAKVQEFWLYHFLEAPMLIRPWLTYRMPTFGFEQKLIDALIKYFGNLAAQEFSFAPPALHATPESIETGRELFVKLKCIQCHESGDAQNLGAAFRAPDLTLARERLKPAWMLAWLREPQALEAGTMMPTFFPEGETPLPDILGGQTEKQIQALVDYLLVFTSEEAMNMKMKSTEPPKEVVST